jgi:hypothetical protein
VNNLYSRNKLFLFVFFIFSIFELLSDEKELLSFDLFLSLLLLFLKDIFFSI